MPFCLEEAVQQLEAALGLCLLSLGRMAGSTEPEGPRHFYPNTTVFQEPEEESDLGTQHIGNGALEPHSFSL